MPDRETPMPDGHLPSVVNAYNAPQVPAEKLAPLPVPEGAGQGHAKLPIPGKTYQAGYTTDWSRGITIYQVKGVGAFEVGAYTTCYRCGDDDQGRRRPCPRVDVTYGSGLQNTLRSERADLPVINRVTLVGGTVMDPTEPAPRYFRARRMVDRYRSEQAPDKTAAKLGALVYALVQHWDRLPEAHLMRAAAVHALAARRYRDALAEQKNIRERIASERIALERAEAAAHHQAMLANASSYAEVSTLMHHPPAPRREYNVYAVCSPGVVEEEPTVVMTTRSLVMSEYDDGEGHGVLVCTDTVYASSAQEAARILREDHPQRHGH